MITILLCFNDAAKSATYVHIFLLRHIKNYRILYELHKKICKKSILGHIIFFALTISKINYLLSHVINCSQCTYQI